MPALTMEEMNPAELDHAIRRANLLTAWRLRFSHPIEVREKLEKTVREEFGYEPGETPGQI
jgi:hypothetical protein